MTNEELIIGHFEGSLEAQQQQILEQRISESPETKAMFDHYRSINNALSADATALAPNKKLDEATLAAALGLVPHVIAGGAMSWLTAKVAVGISAVVIAGASVAYFAGSGPDKTAVKPAAEAPVVRTAPAATPIATPQAAPVQQQPEQAAIDQRQPAPRANATASSDQRTRRGNNAASSNAGTQNRNSRLRIDDRNPANLEHGLRVAPKR